jgi:hypothetical protein
MGAGARTLPLDAEIETELYIHGEDYLVRPTVIELDRAIDEVISLAWEMTSATDERDEDARRAVRATQDPQGHRVQAVRDRNRTALLSDRQAPSLQTQRRARLAGHKEERS